MNPFEEDESAENESLEKSSNIESMTLRLTKIGRRSNTFLEGWDIPENELKMHIKTIKNIKGCNGSVKNGIIQLQGDHIDYLIKYLESKGINKSDIYIKGDA